MRLLVQPMPEKGYVNLTAFHVVPNGPQRSSVFFNGFFSEEGYKTLPLPGRLVFNFRPKWASHLFVHNVFDGDSKILREAPPPACALADLPLQTIVLCGWTVAAALHTEHNGL